MSWDYSDHSDAVETVEHECPTPLRGRADTFLPGGMVFTPAGRWETVTDVDRETVAAVMVRTDRAVWQFWPRDTFPYLPAWEATAHLAARVVVDETTSTITVEVRRLARGRGHGLVFAMLSKGVGWVIQDHPDGAAGEQVTVQSRAKARAEIRRRARAHAKRLGLPLVDDSRRGGRRG